MLKKKIVSAKEEGGYWFTAFLLFLGFQPYFVWHIGALWTVITLLTVFMLFKNMEKKFIAKPYFVVLIITVIVGAICCRSNIFGIIMMCLTTSSVFVTKEVFHYNVYKKLHLIYASTISISMIIWVLVVLFSINIPYHVVDPIVKIKDYDYLVYPFLVRINLNSINFESLNAVYRFHGLYDEPGVVGTISFLFLCSEKFNLSKKWNLAILLSGLLSMSLFFYFASAIYLIIVVLFNKKVKAKVKVALCVFFAFFVVFSYNNEVLNTLVWSRLENKQTARSLIDTRSTDDLKFYVEKNRFTEDYFFGVSDRSIVEKYSDSASIYNAIIGYGMITLLLYAIFFIVYSLSNAKSLNYAIICMFLIGITLSQRPGLFVVYYLFLFRSLIIVPRIEQHQKLIENG